jgi:hypothetical protein
MMVVLFTYIFLLCCKAEVEVERLDQLKASRMKEIAFKRQAELEEIFSHAHIEIDPEAAREKIMALIDSGNVEPTELLTDMDNQIANAKEEALSRRDILDKVEKWMSACEEESWLDDYNRVCIVFLWICYGFDHCDEEKWGHIAILLSSLSTQPHEIEINVCTIALWVQGWSLSLRLCMCATNMNSKLGSLC